MAYSKEIVPVSLAITESIAWGSYLDATHSTSGMGHLTINTSAVFPDSEQLKAAGFLEGWLTAERIHQHFQNMVAFYETSNNENGPAQFQFLATQEVWLRHQMNSSDTQQSPFWAYIRLLMAQFDGLVQGYHARALRPSCPDCIPVHNVQQSSSLSSGQKSTHAQHPSLGQGQGLGGGLLQGQSQGQGQGQGFRRLLAQPLHRTTSLASLPQHGLGSGLASSAAGAEQPGAAGEEQPEVGEEEPLQLLSRVPHLTSAQLYFLCSLGDLGDITAALNRRQAMASQAASQQQGRQQADGQQHGQQGQQGGQEREQVQGGSDNTQGSGQGQGQGQEAAGHSNTGSGRGSSSGSSKVGRRRHAPGSGLVTDWDSLSPRELAVELAAPGRCTAFVKVGDVAVCLQPTLAVCLQPTLAVCLPACHARLYARPPALLAE
ncbi:hypothetical protein QJQ45_019367 [Haematococcus lacustris]|nr:hypothetical protein QJQ45_019367 [Haematococcus lacustris]